MLWYWYWYMNMYLFTHVLYINVFKVQEMATFNAHTVSYQRSMDRSYTQCIAKGMGMKGVMGQKKVVSTKHMHGTKLYTHAQIITLNYHTLTFAS